MCGDDGHPFGIRDIHLHDLDGMALLFHLRLALGRHGGIAIGDDDPRPGLGQGLDAGEPDGTRPAGDDRDTSVELILLQIHQ